MRSDKVTLIGTVDQFIRDGAVFLLEAGKLEGREEKYRKREIRN